jgi:hypothetical protein
MTERSTMRQTLEPSPREPSPSAPAPEPALGSAPAAALGSAPAPVAAAARLLGGFDGWWALCGGWGLDAWLGRQTREHLDVDLAMQDADQATIRAFFGAGWLLNGHDPSDDDSQTQWDGHRLVVPAHIHARGHGQELDIQVERVEGEAWVLRAEPRLALPTARAVLGSAWGVPILAPEATLFFKSGADRRAHDEADFAAIAPLLDQERQAWLRAAIAAVSPAHPWVDALQSGR